MWKIIVLSCGAHPAASLLRGGYSSAGIVLDTSNDMYNYSQELEDYVELDADALATLKGEANTVCHSYTRASLLDREAMPMSQEEDDASRLNTSHFSPMGYNLRKVCFGENWNNRKCMKNAMTLRKRVWKYLRGNTAGLEIFQHLQHSRTSPPQMKTFRVGGGVAAHVRCGGHIPARLYYRHIFKAAGLAITKNLATLAGKDRDDFIDANWAHKGLCHSYLKSKKYAHKGHKPVLFTFVREPMEKFIAGYKEIASRDLIDTIRGAPVGTEEHAKRFLDNVFHGSCDNGHVLLQLQSMMGEACESRFDFIGKLEDFDNEWNKLGSIGGCTDPLAWPHEWTHESDKDSKGLKAESAMRIALAENGGKLTKSLCLWLLPDYLAFEYPFPAPCRGSSLLEI